MHVIADVYTYIYINMYIIGTLIRLLRVSSSSTVLHYKCQEVDISVIVDKSSHL